MISIQSYYLVSEKVQQRNIMPKCKDSGLEFIMNHDIGI